MPPGNATNASASLYMVALRSCIVWTTINCSSTECRQMSLRCNASGITPITLPPWLWRLSATMPMRPRFPPPYISVVCLVYIANPNSLAVSR